MWVSLHPLVEGNHFFLDAVDARNSKQDTGNTIGVSSRSSGAWTTMSHVIAGRPCIRSTMLHSIPTSSDRAKTVCGALAQSIGADSLTSIA